MPAHPERTSPFSFIVGLLLTIYLFVVAFFHGRAATTQADDALTKLAWFSCGAAALVTLCLFFRVLDGWLAVRAARGTDDGGGAESQPRLRYHQ